MLGAVPDAAEDVGAAEARLDPTARAIPAEVLDRAWTGLSATYDPIAAALNLPVVKDTEKIVAERVDAVAIS